MADQESINKSFWHSPSALGSSTFVLLRTIDGFVFSRSVQHFATSRPGIPPALNSATGNHTSSALTPIHTLLWLLSIFAALWHVFWITNIPSNRLSVTSALRLAIKNAVPNILNNFVLCLATFNPTWSLSCASSGTALFLLGLSLEAWSEVQRAAFHEQPANDGKLFFEGLFTLSRHINLFGNLLWRTGIALAAGGWLYALAMAVWYWSDSQKTIQTLEKEYSNRNSLQWKSLKKKVPYILIPWVY